MQPIAAKLAAIDASLEKLDALVAKQAAILLELEHSPGRTFIDPTQLTGTSRDVADAALAEFDGVWRAYTALKDVVDRARTLRRKRRVGAHGLAALDALLHGWSVPEIFDHAELRLVLLLQGVPLAALSDLRSRPTPPAEYLQRPRSAEGMVRPFDLARQVDRRLRHLRQVVRVFADAVPSHLGRLADFQQTISDITESADRIGVRDEAALATVNDVLTATAAALVTDPLSVDVGRLESAVTAAAARIAELTRRHDGLDGDLRNAAALLEQIIELAAAGGRNADSTRILITHPGTLLQLEDGWLDGHWHSLRPWLDRLNALAAAGRWRKASLGLSSWRAHAASTFATAARVAQTNAAPLRRRDELRGLFATLRFKAAKLGVAGRPDLAGLGCLAAEALYAAPTDLDEAARRVGRYAATLAAVSGRPPQRATARFGPGCTPLSSSAVTSPGAAVTSPGIDVGRLQAGGRASVPTGPPVPPGPGDTR